MKIQATDDGVLLTEVYDFSLKDTLQCGQCFRWNEQADGSFIGIVQGRLLHIRQSTEKHTVFLEHCSLAEYHALWESYFDFTRDYSALRERLSELHPALKEACCEAPGIHILHQEPWEALCTFIFSQNNNIPRIRGIVARFCEQFGAPIAEGYYSFPVPERIASLTVEALASLRCGFRAKYLLDAAQKVASGEICLAEIAKLPIEQARTRLTAIYGVGAKVAECTLLYGMGFSEAFPLDVWMKRAMKLLFPEKEPTFFGENAGIAQQYIFYYCRNHHLTE